MITKRCIQFERQADQVLKSFEKLLHEQSTPEVEYLSGVLHELLFNVLPDCRSRSDISPISVGRLGRSHTTYNAVFASVFVMYSASPLDVIVHQLKLPEALMTELAMVA